MMPEDKSSGKEMNQKNGPTRMQWRNNETFQKHVNNYKVHLSERKTSHRTRNKAGCDFCFTCFFSVALHLEHNSPTGTSCI